MPKNTHPISCRFSLPVKGTTLHPLNECVAAEIAAKLEKVEREQDVTILFACESGSRAWGFASPDSDYDVRFVYARSTDRYLTVFPVRDVIEEAPGPVFDLSGWDIRKALGLLQKGNAVLGEWLDSPIVYAADPEFTMALRDEIARLHRPVRAHHHYLHMAQGNYHDMQKGDTVRTKKYFYVLRPLFACLWIEAGLGPVPMRFETLMQRVCPETELHTEITRLLQSKMTGNERAEAPRNPVIFEFMEQELARLSSLHPASREDLDFSPLDGLLAATLRRLENTEV